MPSKRGCSSSYLPPILLGVGGVTYPSHFGAPKSLALTLIQPNKFLQSFLLIVYAYLKCQLAYSRGL
eukprot:1161103-Pelagomonas_calceolata.AAC.1